MELTIFGYFLIALTFTSSTLTSLTGASPVPTSPSPDVTNPVTGVATTTESTPLPDSSAESDEETISQRNANNEDFSISQLPATTKERLTSSLRFSIQQINNTFDNVCVQWFSRKDVCDSLIVSGRSMFKLPSPQPIPDDLRENAVNEVLEATYNVTKPVAQLVYALANATPCDGFDVHCAVISNMPQAASSTVVFCNFMNLFNSLDNFLQNEILKDLHGAIPVVTAISVPGEDDVTERRMVSLAKLAGTLPALEDVLAMAEKL